MKDYYQILGVSSNATSGQIRSAYRRLAVIYHPDKNSDPEAGAKMREVNEAYDVLGDLQKRRDYDWRMAQQVYTVSSPEPARPPHRDPAYRPNRPQSTHKSERQRMYELMQTYVPIAKRVSMFTFLFCTLLILDFISPAVKSHEMIINSFTVGRRSVSQIIVMENGRRFSLAPEDAIYFQLGEEVIIYSSRIMGIPLYISSLQDVQFRFYKTIYGNFVFAPVILLITSLLGVFHKKAGVELKFNLGVVNCLLLCLSLFFLLLPKIFV